MSKTDESEAEMVQWPQVVAYPGGAGGLGAWVDVSTGDGPECITRYFAATPQPAPARVPPGWVMVQVPPVECTCSAKDMPFGRCCKVPPERETDKWESCRVADFNAGWNACRAALLAAAPTAQPTESNPQR